ncbi:MAG: sigma-70 family RNA polymerase sigma factor [Acidobacteriaceae bacterium]|nr:sigma-70 family RNA polymerase sigma factor [Acidobacteriaceae bacterium]
MVNESIPNKRDVKEDTVIDGFLDNPSQESFAALFKTFAPQLVAFFRTRSRELALAEDLAQEVMLTVYRKAGQLRDRASFRRWVFKIAHNALCRHYDRRTREVETVNLADFDNRLSTASHKPSGTHGFEFRDWMALLDAGEREVMMLRFIEEWEYHEIAAIRGTPIGTVQWRIFNSKRKLAKHLKLHHSEKTCHAARQAA